MAAPLLAAALLLALILPLTAALDGCGGSRGPAAAPRRASAPTSAATAARTTASAPRAPARSHPAGAGGFAVGLRVLRIVDPARTIQLPDGRSEPRTLVIYVRYPAAGPAGASDLRNAAPASAGGPFPLVVFGHGFAVTPAIYARLLIAWARAGYVVAAPVFPLGNADAPGGPDESDLANQPADMSLVISSLLAGRGASDALAGLVDPARIAVAGQSDGGDSALAVAYDSRFRDRRVRAAVILSGAEIPGVGGFAFAPGSPPLLAVQGTADTINPPALTETFFQPARPPKYLLRLLGAEHLAPYTSEQPQLGIVQRVTIAFLDAYLEHAPGALGRMARYGQVPGTASLLQAP